MAVPKRRTSKSRIRTRKHTLHGVIVETRPCPACGAPAQPHRVCGACGVYRGRQVVTVKGED